MIRNTVLYFLIFVSICFGQMRITNTSIKIARQMYTKSYETENNLSMQKLSFYSINNVPLLNHLNANTLMLQIEGDSLGSKTPLWKTVGAYSTEYVAGLFGAGFIYYNVVWFAGDYPWAHPYKFTIANTAGNVILGTPLIWGIGKLWGIRGSFIKTTIGVAVGSLVGAGIEYISCLPSGGMVARFVIPFTASLGGVIGPHL